MVAYRRKQGFPHEQVALCVVVQAMVEPDTAGVHFTIDPLGRHPDSMVINAAYGLGESVVSGQVTPDTYRLARSHRFRVEHRHRGAKETRIRSGPDSRTLTEPVPEADRSRFCLDDSALKQLAGLGLAVEAHYGVPQDIEWAFAAGKLFLLQSRPITTVPADSDRASPPRRRGKIEQKLVDSLLEHCPQPPYPLDVAPLRSMIDAKHEALAGLGLEVNDGKGRRSGACGRGPGGCPPP